MKVLHTKNTYNVHNKNILFLYIIYIGLIVTNNQLLNFRDKISVFILIKPIKRPTNKKNVAIVNKGNNMLGSIEGDDNLLMLAG